MTLFVAAVSRDLHTPLTLLALPAEGLSNQENRRRFGKDIAERDAMIRATLDYLSGAADSVPCVALDVGSLLDSIAQDCQDSGQDVQVIGNFGTAPLLGQKSALRLCFPNILENAVRYGDRAKITLEDKSY